LNRSLCQKREGQDEQFIANNRERSIMTVSDSERKDDKVLSASVDEACKMASEFFEKGP